MRPLNTTNTSSAERKSQYQPPSAKEQTAQGFGQFAGTISGYLEFDDRPELRVPGLGVPERRAVGLRDGERKCRRRRARPQALAQERSRVGGAGHGPQYGAAGRKTSCCGRGRCGNLQQVRAGAGRLSEGRRDMSRPVAGAFPPALFTAQLRSTTRARLSLRTPRRAQHRGVDPPGLASATAGVSSVSTTTSRPRPNGSGVAGHCRRSRYSTRPTACRRATAGLPGTSRSRPSAALSRIRTGWSPNWPPSTPNSAS